MATGHVISEPDVLIATTLFLVERGVSPYQFSVAAGKGIDTAGATDRLNKAFAAIGRSPRFVGNGADILGVSDAEWWIIECKGSGTGQPSTQRNNFDRALASVVSYFEEQPQGVSDEQKNLKVCLGLALPATRAYLNELQRRVRPPLRKKLNLWVLLYEPTSRKIRAVSPDDPY
jgi:hypothetical protein